MITYEDRIELTSSDSSSIVASAAMFGFSPTRSDWFRWREITNAEELRKSNPDPRPSMDAQVGWWDGWLQIGLIPGDETKALASSLRKAADWYSLHPGEIPDWFDPYPKWNWQLLNQLLQDPTLPARLRIVASFLENGAVVGTIRKEPYAVILSRNISS